MDDPKQTPIEQTQDAPQRISTQVQPQSPPPVIDQTQRHSSAQTFLIVIVILIGLAGYGLSAYYYMKTTDLEARITAMENDAKSAPTFKEMNQINDSDISKNLETTNNQLKTYLRTYASSHDGMYPGDINPSMSSIIMRSGFGVAAAGPNLTCIKDDKTMYSYNTSPNPATGKYDSFEMYYCENIKKSFFSEKDL